MSYAMEQDHDRPLPVGLRLVETNTNKCDYCVGNNADPTDPLRCTQLPNCSDGGNFMDERMYIKWLTEERMK